MRVGRETRSGAAGARARAESTAVRAVGPGVAALHPGLRRAYERIRDLLARTTRGNAPGRHEIGTIVADASERPTEYGTHAVEPLAQALEARVQKSVYSALAPLTAESGQGWGPTAILGLVLLWFTGSGCCRSFYIPPVNLAANGQDLLVPEMQDVAFYTKGTMFFFGPTDRDHVSVRCGPAEAPLLGGRPQAAVQGGTIVTSQWRSCQDAWVTISYAPNDPGGKLSPEEACRVADSRSFIIMDPWILYNGSEYHHVRFLRPGKCR